MLKKSDDKIIQINGVLFNFALINYATICMICGNSNYKTKIYKPLCKTITISLIISELGKDGYDVIRICEHCLEQLENNYVEFKFKCQHGLN